MRHKPKQAATRIENKSRVGIRRKRVNMLNPFDERQEEALDGLNRDSLPNSIIGKLKRHQTYSHYVVKRLIPGLLAQ